jgi:hypothetical protein
MPYGKVENLMLCDFQDPMIYLAYLSNICLSALSNFYEWRLECTVWSAFLHNRECTLTTPFWHLLPKTILVPKHFILIKIKNMFVNQYIKEYGGLLFAPVSLG